MMEKIVCARATIYRNTLCTVYSGPFIGVPERKRVPPRSAGFPPVLIVIVYPRFNASSCKLWQRSLLILRLQKISLLFPSFEFRISLYRHTLGWIIIRRNFLSISIAFDVCLTSNFWRIFRVAKIKIRLNFPRIQGKGGSRIQYRYRFSRYLPPLHRYVCKFAFVLCSRYSSPFSIGSPYIRAFYSTLWPGSFYPRGNRICSQFSRLYFIEDGTNFLFNPDCTRYLAIPRGKIEGTLRSVPLISFLGLERERKGFGFKRWRYLKLAAN